MQLTKEEIAQSAIRHAGKYARHLLAVSARFGPRAKDIALEYINSSPVLKNDPKYNNGEFIVELMGLIRSEFGKRGAKAKKKKKERTKKKAEDKTRQTSLSFT